MSKQAHIPTQPVTWLPTHLSGPTGLRTEDGLKRPPGIGRGRRVSMVTKRDTDSTLEVKKMTKINLNEDSKSVH